jgi:BirA family biotin operon repressor/biotin-[acetyl-CoA-carboxylase] ligase
MKIFKYESIDSTFLESGRALPSLDKGEYLFLTKEQSAGRGQGDHSFCSPRDNGIYATLLVKRDFCLKTESMLVKRLTPLAAVCATEVLSEYRDGLRIKWINDLLYRDKKYGGILSATSMETDKITAFRIGFGINLGGAQLPEELCGNATSLNISECNYDNIAESIAERIICSLYDDFIEKYRLLCTTVGKKVILENGKSSIAREICNDFTLNVETEAGNIINMKNTSGIKIL